MILKTVISRRLLMKPPDSSRLCLERRGFTLIETVISLTIICLVVMVLYQAFALATRVWSRQRLSDQVLERELAVVSLVQGDLDHLGRYTFNGEKGRQSFFSGGERQLFYVTANAFAARRREHYGLFFACLYLQLEEDGHSSLRLYKTPFPEPELFEALRAYRQADSTQKAVYQLPETIRFHSLLLLDGLEEADFSYAGESFLKASPEKFTTEEIMTMLPLDQRQVDAGADPGRFLFRYRLGGETRCLLAKLNWPPAADRRRRGGSRIPSSTGSRMPGS